MSFIPKKCQFIIDILRKNGYECFAVGGCVRDTILGRVPSDWDFTTNAKPAEILDCFRDYRTIDVGKRFGTIAVVSNDEVYEITTYRIDGVYSDSRHPDEVIFSTTVEGDLARRDFTINSIAYSDESGFVDTLGGVADIERGVIRTTGDPDKRFSEDALRIIRAIRFSGKLGFVIEPDTKKAMFNNRGRLGEVHPQRIRKELSAILVSDKAGQLLNEYRDIFSVVIPEISAIFDLPQNNIHHKYDVWTHTVTAVNNIENTELLRLGMLFHDIGKAYTRTTDEMGTDHFKKHQVKSSEIAKDVLTRFAYPGEIVDKAVLLIRYHDERFYNMRADIKRVLSYIGAELFPLLIKMIRADYLAQSDVFMEEKLRHLKDVESEGKRIIEGGECYSLSQLKINGKDLRDLGYVGEKIGKMLNIILTGVIKEKLKNDRDELLKFAIRNINGI